LIQTTIQVAVAIVVAMAVVVAVEIVQVISPIHQVPKQDIIVLAPVVQKAYL
jgi:hypothetical protein